MSKVSPGRILVVDDEPSMRRVLEQQLRLDGYAVETASSGREARSTIEADEQRTLACVFSDLRMSDGDGMSLFNWLRTTRSELPVVFLTAHGSIDIAVEAMRLGAFDFLAKPHDREALLRIAKKAVAVGRAAHPRTLPPEGHAALDALIGQSPAIQGVKELVRKVADSPSTVLVRGESGTGKELVAEALHALSNRAGPLIKVNCSAIPESLFESELFGHEKGAFTGATHRRPGRFELADKGTLFLDEIGDLPQSMQVKLLRVLQERRFERVGGVDAIEVDVRVVAATNANLEEAVEDGSFREDLFYRLNVVPALLPPLRDRIEDLPDLVEHVLDRLASRLNRPRPTIAPAASRSLAAHTWPGNVRELENVLERAVLLADGDRLEPTDLPAELRREEGSDSPEPEDLRSAVRHHTRTLERRLIEEALQAESWNVTRAAKRLGLSRKGLQLKLKELDLKRPKT